MFVNGYWVTGTPTKKEQRLLKSRFARKKLNAELKLVHMLAFVVFAFPGGVCWLLGWASSASTSDPWWFIPSIWLGLVALYGLSCGIVHLAGMHRIKQVHAFRSSDRVHHCKDSWHIQPNQAFCALREAVHNNECLLSRHKSEVDRYLHDPEVIRLIELLHRTNPAPSQDQTKKLRSALQAKATHTAELLHELDEPHRQLEEQHAAEAEQLKRDQEQYAALQAQADREVLDFEVEQALRSEP